jgi:hypothetical protein
MSVREVAAWASVALKVAAFGFGLTAAYLWYRSSTSVDAATTARWNRYAALTTGVGVLLGGLSMGIDVFWVAPMASWAP